MGGGCFETDSLIVKIQNNRLIFIVTAEIRPCFVFFLKIFGVNLNYLNLNYLLKDNPI